MHPGFKRYPVKSLAIFAMGAVLVISGCFHGYRKFLQLQECNPYWVQQNMGPDLQLLPKLNEMAWPNLNLPNEAAKSDGRFNVAPTTGQYLTVQALLLKFQEVMVALNLQDQWFLSAGTLIGSLRHHDVIPWDDDVDISQYGGESIKSTLTKIRLSSKTRFR